MGTEIKNHIENIIIDYVKFIKEFESLLGELDFDSTKIYDESGVIGHYRYQYHGAGCRLEKNGIICEYDFLPKNNYPIKFSSWKLFEFIRTNNKWNSLIISLDDVHEVLMLLVEDKKIFLLDLGGSIFPIFQIKDMQTHNIG